MIEPWPIAGIAIAVALGLVVGVLSGPVLRSLPEPSAEQLGDAPAPHYARLATRSFALVIGTVVTIGSAWVIWRLPPTGWPAWLGVVTVGVLLAGVDAQTTWLPYRPTVLLWLLTAAGVSVEVALTWPSEGVSALLVPLLCALGAGALFLLLYRLSRGALGFGDVRLVPALAAAGGSVSSDVAIAGLFIGTVSAAIYALVRAARRRSGEFAYGPWLVFGCVAGLWIVS